MIKHIDINTDEYVMLGDIKACLDYPLCGYHDNDTILIAGWVLPPELSHSKIQVIIRVENNHHTYDVKTNAVERPDVLKALRPNQSVLTTSTQLGFSAQVQFCKSSTATIIIIDNNKELPWCRINIFMSDDLTSFVGMVTMPDNDRKTTIDIKSIASSVIIYHPHTINRSHISVVHQHLKKICTSVQTDALILSLYNSTNGHVECKHTELNFDIFKSKTVNHSVFLFCRDDNGLYFIIHQHVTSIDGIYYPSKGVYYSFCHGSHNELERVIQLLLDNAFLEEHQAKSKAYLIGHGRPYHFMYDGMLGLETIYTFNNSLDEYTPFYTLISNAFIDAAKVYDLKSGVKLVNNSEITELEHSGTIFIKIGKHFNNSANEPEIREKIECLDERIRRYSHSINSNEDATLANLKKHFPIIWLGVTGQKRSWLEQVEGCAGIINKLHSSFPGMAVIFDGWTSPLTPSTQDIIESEKDRCIVNEIKELIPDTITTIDLIGVTIDKKVRIGTLVDCAVVNYATGSMNVSRICGRPCVTHMNNSFEPGLLGHIHHNAHHIENKYVTDVSDQISRVDSISYHINWHHIYDAMVSHMHKLCFIKERWTNEHIEK